MKLIINLIILFLLIMLNACTKHEKENDLSGPYLGQKLPGTTPELFAPGIVSTDLFERDFTVSPDETEIYFSVKYDSKRSIVYVKNENGIWSKPKVAPFSGKYDDIEAYIQPDGKKMFFVSQRPLSEKEENKYLFNMWYMNRTESGWDEPKPVPEPINGNGPVYYPSMTKTGVLYFTRLNEDESECIYRSKFEDGKFSPPEKLPDNVNSQKTQYNSFISPDEDFLIVPVPKDNISVYFVSFRDKNDTWSKLIDLGPSINNGEGGFTPSLSHNGKYFFFQRFTNKENSDIYWVDAKFIKDLNPFVN